VINPITAFFDNTVSDPYPVTLSKDDCATRHPIKTHRHKKSNPETFMVVSWFVMGFYGDKAKNDRFHKGFSAKNTNRQPSKNGRNAQL
jgi:hypothetical protein